MRAASPKLPGVLAVSPVRVEYGPGSLSRLGALAEAEGFRSVLLVTDSGLVAAGHADCATSSLRQAGIEVHVFDGAAENPTTQHVAKGIAFLGNRKIDALIGLGGGSSMDCAKGMNLILTNGGSIADYWGVGKTIEPMLPMIAVPTTAGTGSEAQSFALITDAATRQKMACGDRRLPEDGGLRPRIAILDPELTESQPPSVAAATGIDAIAHAVETAGCTARNAASLDLSNTAWQLLEASYEHALQRPDDIAARSAMLLGAHLAGAAIEQSMLGAAHACANPLTAKYGIIHGNAVGVMLPHVVRFNSRHENPYSEIMSCSDSLALRLRELLVAGGRPVALSELKVQRQSLPELADMAAKEWTASFNPVKVGPMDLLSIYESAY